MKKSFKFLFLFVLLFSAKSVFAEDVARIGSTNYSSLNDAIGAATSGQEIVLLSNVSRIVIPEGKNLTINLNGHNVDPTLLSGISIANNAVENNGTLILEGSGIVKCFDNYRVSKCIVNKTGANMTLKDFNMTEATTENIINNDGTITITNLNITNNGYGYLFYNGENSTMNVNSGTYSSKGFFDNRGVLNLKNGTYNIHDSSLVVGYSKGTINISGGSYSLSSKINNLGLLNINGGEFTGKTIAENSDVDYGSVSNSYYANAVSTIVVNDASINTQSTPFSNNTLNNHSGKIIIKGGNVSCSSEDYIISDYSGDTIEILGGTVSGPNSKGLFFSSNTKFTLGNDDDTVLGDSPVVNMPKGKFNISGSNGIIKFYDGYINLKEQISNSFKITTPTDYYVTYSDQNGYYKAYLTKNTSDVPVVNNTLVTDSSNPEIIKVPDTFKTNGEIIALVGLITLVLGSGMIVRTLKTKRN